jgi:Thiamine pyrophosphate enzyme, N-terminal TPP binding domain
VTEHSLETSAAEQLQTTSVADYIVQRIADEGVTHCFGVAGDYLFPMCNAVEHSWIGCANELSALNGVMGAKSRALVGVSCGRHAVLPEPALEQDPLNGEPAARVSTRRAVPMSHFVSRGAAAVSWKSA